MVIDAEGEKWDEDKTLQVMKTMKPAAIGLSVTSYTLKISETWAGKLKKMFRSVNGENDNVKIIAGGPHASMSPKDVLQRCPSIDVVVRGEAEIVFPSLVDRLKNGSALSNLPGVLERGAEDSPLPEILRVDDQAFKSLAFPRLDGLPIHNYWCPDAKTQPMVTFMTARGCPFKCGFCNSPQLFGKAVRGWEVPAILDELQRLTVEAGVREVSFVDDVFTAVPRRTLQLCRGMIDRRLGLSWFCNARADQISAELATAMAEAGCHQARTTAEALERRLEPRLGCEARPGPCEPNAARALRNTDTAEPRPARESLVGSKNVPAPLAARAIQAGHTAPRPRRCSGSLLSSAWQARERAYGPLLCQCAVYTAAAAFVPGMTRTRGGAAGRRTWGSSPAARRSCGGSARGARWRRSR